MAEIKQQEYDLLREISQNSMVTQASLSKRLGIAVGSVNWYIKRLIKKGYIKVSHLDRTRLRYDLTPQGMSVFTERAIYYAKNSLKVYKEFRQKSKVIVSKLKAEGITKVCLEGSDEIMDILRLTCLDKGIEVCNYDCRVSIESDGQAYQINMHQEG